MAKCITWYDYKNYIKVQRQQLNYIVLLLEHLNIWDGLSEMVCWGNLPSIVEITNVMQRLHNYYSMEQRYSDYLYNQHWWVFL